MTPNIYIYKQFFFYIFTTFLKISNVFLSFRCWIIFSTTFTQYQIFDFGGNEFWYKVKVGNLIM